LALFWMNVSKASSASGQSASAHVAYLIRDGKYARARSGERDRCLFVESTNMPGAWAREAEGPNAEKRSAAAVPYWTAAVTHLRSNGRQCRKVDFAMPRELDRDQQIALARGYLNELSTLKDGSSKLPFSWVLHEGGGGVNPNPHVHAIVSEKIVDGFDRTPETWFRRAAVRGRPAESGGARQTDELDTKEWLMYARELWATRANSALEAAGFDARIDHRSNADRGLSDLPTEHVGWAAGRPRQEALKRNAQRQELNVDLRAVLDERARLDQLQEIGAESRQGDHDHEHDHKPAGRPGLSDLVGNPAAGLDAERADAGANLDAGIRLAKADRGTAGSPAAATKTRAAARAGIAAPTCEFGVLYMRRGGVADRAAGNAGVLPRLAHADLGAGRDDSVYRLQRETGSRSNIGHGLIELVSPMLAQLVIAKRSSDSLTVQDVEWRPVARDVDPAAASRARQAEAKEAEIVGHLQMLQLLQALLAWILRLVERLLQLVGLHEAAAQVAVARQRAGLARGLSHAPRLSNVPALSTAPTLASLPKHRLTAVSLRPLEGLSARDLAEQLAFAPKGVVVIQATWQAALIAGDRQRFDDAKAQYAARRARVDALMGELARREAVPAPAPTPPQTETKEMLMEMPLDRLREQEQIAASAMREAARLAFAGGAVGQAAAERLRNATARVKRIGETLAERERVAAEAAAAAAPVPVEMPLAPPVRDELELAAAELADATAGAKRATWVVARRTEIEREWLALDRCKAAKAWAATPSVKASADAARAAAFGKLKDAAMAARGGRLEVPGLGEPGTRQANLQALADARETAAAAEARREAAGRTVQQLQAVAEALARVVTPPAPAVARDVQSQVDALRSAVEAARALQAERAARHPAVQPTPEQVERTRRADYDVPGRRRTT